MTLVRRKGWTRVDKALGTLLPLLSHEKPIGEQKVRSCRVTITDREGVTHTVQLTASTLYEAVALGLMAIRGHEWVGETGGDFSTVKVSVMPISVEHAVQMRKFTRWVDKTGGSPREGLDHDRVRAILKLGAQPESQPHETGRGVR
jgi:hypothetical protein